MVLSGRRILLVGVVLGSSAAAFLRPRAATGANAPESLSTDTLSLQFNQSIHPFLETYCISCHGDDKPDGGLNLKYSSLADVQKDSRRLDSILERVRTQKMPPADADKHPTPEGRRQVLEWFASIRTGEMKRHAGDPGVVLARRLSNAEYNYTVRDLTGVDIQPTKEFPADPANTAGFDNSGETLVMSPELLNKSLKAARDVADHMFLTPDGFEFAPYPMLVETDQDKYCVSHILDVYHRVTTDYAEYFEAAWRYKNRAALGKPDASLADFATGKISAKYLAMVWSMLNEPMDVGPGAKLQSMWQAIPAAQGNNPAAANLACREMRDYVVAVRKKVEPRFLNLPANRSQGNGQGGPSVAQLIWRNVQYATHRMTFDAAQLQVEGEPLTPPLDVKNEPNATSPYGPGRTVPVINKIGDPDLVVPAGQRAKYEAAFGKFCSVFPDRFYMEERGRNYFNTTEDRGRFLNAGFHSSMGYFRDDQPLHDMLLSDAQKKELDDLWVLFDFTAHATERMYLENAGGRRGANTLPPPVFGGQNRRGDNAAATQPTTGPAGALAGATTQPTTQPMVRNTAAGPIAVTTQPAGNGQVARDAASATQPAALPLEALAGADDRIDFVSEEQIKKNEARFMATSTDEGSKVAGHAYYQWINETIRAMEKARATAEPKHLQSLLKFAAAAYRRPLTQDEKDDLLGYYHTIRKQDKLDHEAAMRETVVAVLMSPDCSYHISLADKSGVNPLSDYELASRLSYFLWSSIPDEELLSHAAAGDLHQPSVVEQQASRMLRDPRARALAVEFGANWLDIRRFQELNTVDRQRFESFTPDLRDAMFEEPIRLMQDVFQQNHSILDLVFANYTFVNPVLAEHYGLPTSSFPVVGRSNDLWVRCDDASTYGRGGLLPMAVFLTKNAPGLRTSPVKRGNWVVRNILGEIIPPPPAVVPELPKDEAKAELPLRQMLAHHREIASCAACHDRIDSMGLVFEGFGPVGEKREKDLAGRPIDDAVSFPGGSQGVGVTGLKEYIQKNRQQDFVRNFCGKVLAYALGRSPILSDELLVDDLNQKLAGDDYRFESVVRGIVTSPQFLNKRGREDFAER